MDEYRDGHADGWVGSIAEAERRCVKVWLGDREVLAVVQTELVQIRGLVELAQAAREQS